ncbi:MAG TPA: LTA synthase family protein [Xanthomonadaceae bacterium]|nr:LTA synthase family protein [Xanthomonadaceae bacterium]
MLLRRHLLRVPFWLLVLLPPVLAFGRAWLAASVMAHLTGCFACSLVQALANDAWLVASAWALLALVRAAPHVAVRVPVLVLVLLLALAMTADLAILATLNMRLYLADVFKFGGEAGAITDFVEVLLGSERRWMVLGVAACLLLGGAALFDRTRSRGAAVALGVLAACAAGFAAIGGRAHPSYIHDETFDNLLALHRAQAVNAPYSPERTRQLLAAPPPALHCEPGQGRRPDIVLLLVESLSSYHSALHGGADLTPQLDAIARGHSWFPEFHASGFTTDQGLIALLNGRVPVPAVGRYGSLDAFGGFVHDPGAAPFVLERHGYSTHFFTTGDLGFLDKPTWLRGIGFDHYEGAEHPFYAPWPRGAFSAAEDRALYQRFEQWLDARQDTRAPYFAVLLTVQSHPPFLDRESGRVDEESAFRRVDAAAGRFVRALQGRGFFEHGLLLITGDHRSMTPLRAAQYQAHGMREFARVPMIVAGQSGLPPGAVSGAYAHTDLLPSLEQLVSERSCHRRDQGRFLRPDPQPPAWVLHVRGSPRDRVDAYVGDVSASFRMAGDDSGWVGEPPPHAEAIAAQIHRERIAQGQLQGDIPALLRLLGLKRPPEPATEPARED